MFDRITSDPAILGGKPVIKGTRISVEMVLEWLASGAGPSEIVQAYPHLLSEDIEQAILYSRTDVRLDVCLVTSTSGDVRERKGGGGGFPSAH